MIKVEHLAKRYADVYAVNDVSFEVHQGEIVGLLGPNGAGKTTTMRILTCYMPATSGSATVAGYDVFRESINVRKQIGYLPENVPLYPEMRVKEYLLFRAKLKKLPSRERKTKIDECIEKCRITEVQNQIIGTLSKGYRQRVGLADTLVHDPKILILDEPTIGLDPNQIRQVRQLIKELGAKHTILLSTHILPEVEMLCERVIIINKGKIVAMDTPANLAIQLRAGNNLILEVRGNGEKIKNALTNIKSVKKVVWQDKGEISNFTVEAEKGADVREDVFSNIVKNNGIIREMKQATITLEEIFHQITMREQEVTT
ncbi:MAG TPA: ABC transporter ATP-binding protein [Candidatus Wujingus californicus]|uniref:ABC transporter ATP-binding protein n=1 Tax=Candidatus Wujingus californicus TaxID=3367618 RepID=UPI001DB11D81|nr:ATP-binding cassette domain-containing protein [Planctomycetota bacterium]MDO8131080.1 ATP-binding cassette domain-containing protein [Candidatus Brocadiales bacterium]